MARRLCVVTGATNGIGKATARELLEKGDDVVVVGRSAEKPERVADELTATGGGQVHTGLADYTELDSVRALGADLLERFEHIDVLINNAGGQWPAPQYTSDGNELTFQVNHLAGFLLTNLLLERLAASADARVVNVSSLLHASGAVAEGDITRPPKWGGYGAYSHAKLCNVLHANALARRTDPVQVTANSLHPGVVRTGFGNDARFPMNVVALVAKIFAISPVKGARTSVWAATAPELEGVTGAYFSDSAIATAAPAARDEVLQDLLWEASEELVSLAV